MSPDTSDNQLNSALSGILALDLSTGLAGALATMFLCDNGARVVRVTEPGQPVVRAEPIYALWDRGKEVVTANIASDRGALDRLAASADVVVEDSPPDSTGSAGALLNGLKWNSPRLIHCSITGYGQVGPLAGEPADPDLVLARMGVLASQPSFRDGPIHVMHPVANVGAGLLAAIGIVAALYQREETGRGTKVETSLMAGALLYSPRVRADKLQSRSFRMSSPQGGGPFYSVFECADGEWLQLGCIHSGFVDLAAAVMGIAHEMTDPEFGDGRMPQNEEARLRLFNMVADVMKTRPAAEWQELFEAADVPSARSGTAQEALNDPQILYNDMAMELDDPVFGKTTLAGVPIRLSKTPGRVRGPRPAQAVGLDDVLDSLSSSDVAGSDEQQEQDGAARDDMKSLPLAGVNILEVTNVIAGPIAGRLLADLGAEMIKFESLDGDISRHSGWAGFLFYNANKQSISVNTRTPQGRDVARRLAANADMLLANMRPGATDRMGLDSDSLAELNPELIEAHVTAYGWTGPYAHRPGVDPLAQAITGLQREQGGKGPPMFLGILAPTDYTAGAMGALGATLALYVRRRYGIVQKMNTNLLSGGIMMGADGFMRAADKPARVLTDGEHYGVSALRRLYHAKDGWLYMAADDERHWGPLCEASGIVDLLTDARFQSRESRTANQSALVARLQDAIGSRTVEDVLGALGHAGVPSAPVVGTYDDAFFDQPQPTENGLISHLRHPNLGGLSLAANLVKFSGRSGGVALATPLLGEQTRQILSEAGFSDAEISDLYEAGVAKTELPT